MENGLLKNLKIIWEVNLKMEKQKKIKKEYNHIWAMYLIAGMSILTVFVFTKNIELKINMIFVLNFLMWIKINGLIRFKSER